MLKLIIKFLIIFLCLLSIVPICFGAEISVGIYQNEPLLFSTEDKNPQGVFVEILEAIAKKEDWTLRYVENAWLENLDDGSIDILLCVAYSEPRDRQYDFNTMSVVSNWGQLYRHENSEIDTFIDISDKKIAALKGDIYYIYFKSIIEKFDIIPHYIEVDTYAEILELLDSRKADAGILPRIYGRYHEKNHNIIQTPINFTPTSLRFVTKKEKNQEILATIDRHLKEMKKNKNSIYYRSQNYWIEGVRKVTFPFWLKPGWVFLFIILIILIFFIGNVVLTRIVRIKTEQLKESIASQERILSELKIAHEIQMEMVPTKFPPFPEKKEFEIYALLQPAKEVGGDFYDFFLIDPDNLCLVIGDVSGKGVPAALFMAMAKTCIKTTAKVIDSPQKIIESVNRELSEENDSCTFVTAFLAILNLKTGMLRFTNAGHNPPVISPADSAPYLLEGAECPAIGFDEETLYSEKSIQLSPEDAICLYTDGVTEAENNEKEDFSERRLIEKLADAKQLSPKDTTLEIIRSVNSFSGQKAAFDDITILMLKYFGA